MDKKTSLRLQAKKIRKELDIVHVSNIITDKISGLDIFKNAQNINPKLILQRLKL